MSLGLFDLLRTEGVEVDSRGIPHRRDPQIVLPLTRFRSQTDVEGIANEVLDRLSTSGLGAANLHPRFVCGVGDGGIGIRASLSKNPEFANRIPYDWVAIELAVRERVSGTGDRTRGIGLYGIAEDMRRPGRHLIIHSGLGSLAITEQMETEARRTSLFPGTLAYASIPT
jgi:hypothetical protein